LEAFSVQAFRQYKGIVAPLDRVNVDTDQIIPKQFLKRIERTGFGRFLFFDWRFLDGIKPNPDFVLNQERYQGAGILLTRDNFGCGSSREHAPWALLDYGFRVIIAPSVADIFYNNCYQNGILPIKLDADIVQQLFEKVEREEGYQLKVDLEAQTITDASGWTIPFEIDEYRRHCLLEGLDEIGITLQYEDAISRYEAERASRAVS